MFRGGSCFFGHGKSSSASRPIFDFEQLEIRLLTTLRGYLAPTITTRVCSTGRAGHERPDLDHWRLADKRGEQIQVSCRPAPLKIGVSVLTRRKHIDEQQPCRVFCLPYSPSGLYPVKRPEGRKAPEIFELSADCMQEEQRRPAAGLLKTYAQLVGYFQQTWFEFSHAEFSVL